MENCQNKEEIYGSGRTTHSRPILKGEFFILLKLFSGCVCWGGGGGGGGGGSLWFSTEGTLISAPAVASSIASEVNVIQISLHIVQ